jgi:hypothetical protein
MAVWINRPQEGGVRFVPDVTMAYLRRSLARERSAVAVNHTRVGTSERSVRRARARA